MMTAWILLTVVVGNGDAAANLVKANTAYEEGRYGEAVELYESLTADGIDNGHLWLNLGNSYLRTGDLGAAVAGYLRAEALLPRDADIEANLAFARKSSQDAIAPAQSTAVIRTLFFWHFALSRLEIAQALVLLNLLFWSLLAARLFRRRSEWLRWALFVALIPLVALGASLVVRTVAPRRLAVIRDAEIDVHSGTGRDTVVQFKLHAGTQTQWIESRDDWLRIALPDGKQGWVPADEVIALTL